MTDDSDVKVARLEVRVESLKSDMVDVKRTLAGQDDKLDRLLMADQQRKGARAVTKVLVTLLTSGGLIGWAWEHFSK